tara:strand:+ start:365 stop:601 length:237 start_codon:yes stop_codon:yes gene_type:complete
MRDLINLINENSSIDSNVSHDEFTDLLDTALAPYRDDKHRIVIHSIGKDNTNEWIAKVYIDGIKKYFSHTGMAYDLWR